MPETGEGALRVRAEGGIGGVFETNGKDSDRKSIENGEKLSDFR